METDQTQKFLDAPRQYQTERRVVKLPQVPFGKSSIQVIAGSGVIDILPVAELEKTFMNAFDALEPGGYFYHILDLTPNWEVEVQAAREQGMVLFPLYTEYKPDNYIPTGFYYLPESFVKIFLFRAMDEGMIPEIPNKDMFLEDNYRWLDLHADQQEYLDLFRSMGEDFDQSSVGAVIVSDYVDVYNKRLRETAEKAGMDIVYCGNLTKTVEVEQSELPRVGVEYNRIVAAYGRIYDYCWDEQYAQEEPGMVKIELTVHQLIARKPEVEDSRNTDASL